MRNETPFVYETSNPDIRDLLIETSNFRVFSIQCAECDESLVQVGDLTKSVFKNEILIYYQMNSHARKTGHTRIHGKIEPQNALQHLDVTITVEK